MRGHQPLIAMRRARRVPLCVWIDVDDQPSPLQMWRGWERETPTIAQIEIEPGDPIERLDLRCLIGMRVHVHGDNEVRVKRVFDACVNAGADVVHACVCWGEYRGGEFRTTGSKSRCSEAEEAEWHTC